MKIIDSTGHILPLHPPSAENSHPPAVDHRPFDRTWLGHWTPGQRRRRGEQQLAPSARAIGTLCAPWLWMLVVGLDVRVVECLDVRVVECLDVRVVDCLDRLQKMFLLWVLFFSWNCFLAADKTRNDDWRLVDDVIMRIGVNIWYCVELKIGMSRTRRRKRGKKLFKTVRRTTNSDVTQRGERIPICQLHGHEL